MPSAEITKEIVACIDEQRLVELACSLVDIPSPTGSEQLVAEKVAEVCQEIGLAVTLQEVEAHRPNVLAILAGSGGGPTLMFNGHIDTSYSGAEPHLRAKPGFQPKAFVRDQRIWGLGIANMKGAVACYVEAVRALRDAGVGLRGDVMIAAVAGEIEKSQWGEEFRGAQYRGYSAGTHYLVGHGGAADMCILGEPTEQRIVLGHYGTLWARISTHGPFVHTAFARELSEENSIVRAAALLSEIREWIPGFERQAAYGGANGIVSIGAVQGGHPWRVSRTPERTDLFLDIRVPPTMRMQQARAAFADLVRELSSRHLDFGIESEVFVTSPGAEIAPDHPLVAAIDASHKAVFESPPERDTVRWSSDASVLTRYGIESVNYGTSSGLPHPDGENLEIDGLVRTAQVYALTAAQICEVTQ
ncbi:MAG: M20 family metallopeptidase [Acidimicrobiales bacterium]